MVVLKTGAIHSGVLKSEGLEGRRRLIGMSVREPGVAAPDIEYTISGPAEGVARPSPRDQVEPPHAPL